MLFTLPEDGRDLSNEAGKIVIKTVDCSSLCRNANCILHTSGRATQEQDKLAAKRIDSASASQSLRKAKALFQQNSVPFKLLLKLR